MDDLNDTCDESQVDSFEAVVSTGFIEYFALLQDFRTANKTSYSLLEIIFTTVCTYIYGANSWEGVVEFLKARKEWLLKYIEIKNGIPSLATYWKIFVHLDPHAFSQCFNKWTYALLGNTKHIAIDGKALRGAYDKDNPNTQLILVSVWATERAICC